MTYRGTRVPISAIGVTIAILAAVVLLLLRAFVLPGTEIWSATPTATPNPLVLALTRAGTFAPPAPLGTSRGQVPAREPDPRFAEFEKVYSLRVGEECAAPCITFVYNIRDAKPVTLGEFVARVGPQERVRVALFSPGEQEPGIVAQLFYIQKGFSVDSVRPADLRDEITPTMVVGRLELFRSRTLDGIAMEEQQLTGTQIVRMAEDWKGFGPIKVHGR